MASVPRLDTMAVAIEIVAKELFRYYWETAGMTSLASMKRRDERWAEMKGGLLLRAAGLLNKVEVGAEIKLLPKPWLDPPQATLVLSEGVVADGRETPRFVVLGDANFQAPIGAPVMRISFLAWDALWCALPQATVRK